MITFKNKSKWLQVFRSIVKSNWKPEYNTLMSSIIIRQHLYTDIYVEMVTFLSEKDSKEVIENIITSKSPTPVESKTVGYFIAKWAIESHMNNTKLELLFKDNLEYKTGMAIHAFITLKTNNKANLIPLSTYERLQKIEHSSNTLMAYYDLEEMLEVGV